ncbi:MAG TPA: DUF1840 domain-containing protein [Burkholderiaceae bacterium]|jgi:hypothetical protein
MLYKFKSKAGGDVIMMGPQGDQMLQLLGRAPAAKGIFQAADLAQAIETLSRAVADDEAAFGKAQADAKAAGEAAPRRDGVQLKQRVWPLIELMRQSLAEKTDVVWGV